MRISILLFLITTTAYSQVLLQNTNSISPADLQAYSKNPAPVQLLINNALNLAKQKLGYLYGSANPINKGMDCSGTVYYLLNSAGIKEVPRSSDAIYEWVVKKGRFKPYTSNTNVSLKPGDLLFWSGTYEIKRKSNITHVMIYIGKDQNNSPLMVGASNGRTYKGLSVYGVSVFDFKIPERGGKGQFVGYSCIPGLSC